MLIFFFMQRQLIVRKSCILFKLKKRTFSTFSTFEIYLYHVYSLYPFSCLLLLLLGNVNRDTITDSEKWKNLTYKPGVFKLS